MQNQSSHIQVYNCSSERGQSRRHDRETTLKCTVTFPSAKMWLSAKFEKYEDSLELLRFSNTELPNKNWQVIKKYVVQSNKREIVLIINKKVAKLTHWSLESKLYKLLSEEENQRVWVIWQKVWKNGKTTQFSEYI